MGPSLSVNCQLVQHPRVIWWQPTQIDPRIKTTIGTEQIQGSLSVVALASLVDLCLRQHNQRTTVVVPLELDLITFEEVLLRHRSGEVRHIVNSNGCWLSLTLV